MPVHARVSVSGVVDGRLELPSGRFECTLGWIDRLKVPRSFLVRSVFVHSRMSPQAVAPGRSLIYIIYRYVVVHLRIWEWDMAHRSETLASVVTRPENPRSIQGGARTSSSRAQQRTGSMA